MRVLVVGSNSLAISLASRLRKAGHQAGTYQNLEHVAGLETMALGARVVFLVVPFHQCLNLPHRVFLARVVADATDYFRTPGDGVPPQGQSPGQSPSERLAAHLHGADLVRIVNAVALLSTSEQEPVGGPVPRVSVPIAGDDARAKTVVSGLIADLGLDVVDLGSLADASSWQPESTLRLAYSREADPRIRIADV